jgi:hypothetical protein
MKAARPVTASNGCPLLPNNLREIVIKAYKQDHPFSEYIGTCIFLNATTVLEEPQSFSEGFLI